MLAWGQYRKPLEPGQEAMNPIKYFAKGPILIALAGMRLIHGELGRLMERFKGSTLGIFPWPVLVP
jgi:hypothetical protein